MESKHTPGPWRAETHEKSGIVYIMGKLSREAAVNMIGDGVVAEVNASDCTDDGMFPPRDPEAEANARLIAAAPDLLEALKDMTALYCMLANSGDCGYWDPEEVPQIKAARAAISKAENQKD